MHNHSNLYNIHSEDKQRHRLLDKSDIDTDAQRRHKYMIHYQKDRNANDGNQSGEHIQVKKKQQEN